MALTLEQEALILEALLSHLGNLGERRLTLELFSFLMKTKEEQKTALRNALKNYRDQKQALRDSFDTDKTTQLASLDSSLLELDELLSGTDV